MKMVEKEEDVVEIKDLTVENIWDEAGFCFQQLNPATPYSEGDEERYLEGNKRKAKFLEEKLKRGGRAKIAYRGNNVIGFIEYYPIEIAPMEIVGKDLMVTFCMDVKEKRKGIGSTLLNACFEDSRKLRRKGVAVTCSDDFWMAQSFFQKQGFIEVVKGNGCLSFSRSLKKWKILIGFKEVLSLNCKRERL